MTNYAEFWKPADVEQAKWLIDTGHEGEAFWQWGEDTALELQNYMPGDCEYVLDYGCGVGRVLLHMPSDMHRIGVDVSPEMLDCAREYVLNVSYLITDGDSIPKRPDSLDFVYSLITLQHMDAVDVISVVNDTVRVLSVGRTCYLQFSGWGKEWTPDATIQRGPIERWGGPREDTWTKTHGVIKYTLEIIDNLAQQAGFSGWDIIDTQGATGETYLALVATV